MFTPIHTVLIILTLKPHLSVFKRVQIKIKLTAFLFTTARITFFVFHGSWTKYPYVLFA